MRLKTLKLDLSGELLKGLGDSDAKLAAELKKLAVLELFKRKKVSSGKAAELLGMSRQEFWDLLYKEGVPYYDYSSEELEKEFKMAHQVSERLSKEKASK